MPGRFFPGRSEELAGAMKSFRNYLEVTKEGV
jgi:hypothetical protein